MNEIPSSVNIAEWNKDPSSDKGPLVIPKWILSEENFNRILNSEWEKIMPVTAEVVPTLNCDFRCNQCSYVKPKRDLGVWIDEKSGKFKFNRSSEINMDIESMRKVVDRLVDGGVKNILLTGGGEPFMNKSVTLYGIGYAKERGLKIGLYSNGSLINSRTAEELMRLSPLFIRISLYGGNFDAFNLYTRQSPRLYERVIQNIRELARKKIETGSETRLGLSYLLHPLTIVNIGKLVDSLTGVLSDSELKVISFCRFTPAVDYFDGNQHSREVMDEALNIVNNEIKPRLEEKGIETKLYDHRLNDLYKKKEYKSCRASGWYLECGPSGDVFLCCEKLFLPEYKIGNLLEQTIEEIYTSDLRKSVVQIVNRVKCVDCPPLCKPHELNKIFQNAEILVEAGKSDLIRRWRNDLLIYGENRAHFFGRLNDFES